MTADTNTSASAVPQTVTAETKLTLDSVPADFATNPQVKTALSKAIADSIPGIDAEHVTITEIVAARRLGAVKQSTPRKLTGDVTVKYTINVPSTYTGGTMTASTIDPTTLKNNINTQLQAEGVSATVTALEVTSLQSVPADTSSPTITKAPSPSPGTASDSVATLPGVLTTLSLFASGAFASGVLNPSFVGL
jgi:hypothetical protein